MDKFGPRRVVAAFPPKDSVKVSQKGAVFARFHTTPGDLATGAHEDEDFAYAAETFTFWTSPVRCNASL